MIKKTNKKVASKAPAIGKVTAKEIKEDMKEQVKVTQPKPQTVQQNYHTSQSRFPYEELTKSGMQIDEMTKQSLLVLGLGGAKLISINHTLHHIPGEKRMFKVAVEILGE